MNIRLHIERLVFDGVLIPPDQRPYLQAAIEAELTRLLSARGIAGGINARLYVGASLYSVNAGQIEISSGRNPAELGRQIAVAVYGGIEK
ncbi:hypothetical protein C8R32_1169 [Nitrosospira sp. Nsp5]|uniref:Uncharacterized protein n=1 Tax=Nitrosospira multiformis TaxID=1231 RepID=A0ABY0TCJ4_9PROT|nr:MULTISPECIES: hypothetical protein [Nitrosospira]PTR05763.1 hypothetical protein C8R32_1169 [Nitrosospira sp. Nsp5]SDQ62362.1 hypothetical protein SAMN05216402_1592 [Nitrosospira multiformis]